MDKIKALMPAVLLLALTLGGCGQPDKTDISEDTAGVSAANDSLASPHLFEAVLPENQATTFEIQSSVPDGVNINQKNNIYTITAAGEYDCSGNLFEGQLVVEADEDAEVIVNLNDCLITNSAAEPISLLTAGKVEIAAKKDTENKVYDLRTMPEGNEEPSGGAIDAECDLTLKGNGMLEVISNYNNGIHTKDDLKIKNLTLTVMAPNHALRGNDSVTIESGTVTAISSGGDAVKTSSTDLNKNEEQRGTVEIFGGTVTLYAACDGIDSASNVDISGDAVLDIYTDEYSPYSSDYAMADGSAIYLRLDQSIYEKGYQYSAFFYNEEGNGQWVNAVFDREAAPAMGDGNRGGITERKEKFGHENMRGDKRNFIASTYYYYSVERPAQYANVRFYAYTSAQTPGQNQDYAVASEENAVIPKDWDTYIVTMIDGKSLISEGWTSYTSNEGKTDLEYSCKGIKAANTITVSGGAITIHAKDDGLNANFDEVLESTGVNGLGNILISGGTVTVSSGDDGIHADQDLTIEGGTVKVLTSYEGLEGNRIYLSDGSVIVQADDDAINANNKGAYQGYIEISSGFLDAAVPNGDTDTLDSNGTILIRGGMVLLKNGQMSGSSMGGGTFDAARGVSVTGGTVIAVGCIGNVPDSGIYSASQTFESGDYTICDKSGNPVTSFTLSASYRGYIIYSDSFQAGQSYAVCRGTEVLFEFLE